PQFAQLLDLPAAPDEEDQDDDGQGHPRSPHADEEGVDKLLGDDVGKLLPGLERLQVLVVQGEPDRVEDGVDDDLAVQAEKPEELDQKHRHDGRGESASQHGQGLLNHGVDEVLGGFKGGVAEKDADDQEDGQG